MVSLVYRIFKILSFSKENFRNYKNKQSIIMTGIELDNELFGSLKYFCMFIGYPYSGHSLVGSIIDAHPNAAISHELHVGRLLKKGFTKDRIFSMIILNTMKFAHDGRIWNNHSYAIPGEWNGRFTSLRVIGDKRGGGSSRFFSKKTEILDALSDSLGLPVKYIHVMRNPFDMIGTLFRKTHNRKIYTIRDAIEEYINRIVRTEKIKKSIQPENWLDIYHEQFLASPVESITTLFNFLELEIPNGFIENCRKLIYANPHKSRFDVIWNEEDIAFVSNELARFEHFSSYTFNS